MNEKVRDAFDSIASKYDSNRKKLIPCFDALYSIPISLIPETSTRLNVLDIGAETGLLTAFLLEKYPDSNVTLINMTGGMMDIAKIRFKDNNNINYTVADYINLKILPYLNLSETIINAGRHGRSRTADPYRVKEKH